MSKFEISITLHFSYKMSWLQERQRRKQKEREMRKENERRLQLLRKLRLETRREVKRAKAGVPPLKRRRMMLHQHPLLVSRDFEKFQVSFCILHLEFLCTLSTMVKSCVTKNNLYGTCSFDRRDEWRRKTEERIERKNETGVLLCHSGRRFVANNTQHFFNHVSVAC